jgi:hypothetical protein
MSDESQTRYKAAPELRFEELRRLKYNMTEDLYRRHARQLEADNKRNPDGSPIEYYLYKILGADLMGSIAFALDPYWQFQLVSQKDGKNWAGVYLTKVYSANRKRIFPCIWPQKILSTEKHHAESLGNNAVFNGSSWSVGPLHRDSIVDLDYSGVLGTQELVNGFVIDTTDKSRNGSKSDRDRSMSGVPKAKRQMSKGRVQEQGGFEMFKCDLSGTNLSYNYLQGSYDTFQRQAVTGPGGAPINTVNFQRIRRHGFAHGVCCTVAPLAVNNYLSAEKNNALSIMSSKADMMFERCLPKGRQYNLAYQVGELKDLPSLVHSLFNKLVLWKQLEQAVGKDRFKELVKSKTAWSKDFVKSYGSYLKALEIGDLDKEIANLYLEFKFGWESFVQAIQQLVRAPQTIGKKVNYLISRNGKNVTFRSNIRYVESNPASFPPVNMLTMALLNTDATLPVTQSASREVSLRCMVSAKMMFPYCDVPSLKTQLWVDKLGADPSPGDIYDLVPWTWMIDWFAGLGDYIHLMDAVNDDRFLINFGLLTYVSKLTVEANQYLYGQCTQRTYVIPPNTATGGDFRYVVNSTGRFTSKYQLRRDLAEFATSAKLVSGKGLSLFQGSILTALFSKYR